MPPKAQPPEAKDRPKHLQHVHYEVNQLALAAMCTTQLATAVRLDAPDRVALLLGLNNALVESVAIHLRNVHDFLAMKDLFGDDIQPTHFVPDWKPLSPMTRNEQIRVNKEIAHLTYARKEDGDPEKAWTIDTIINVVRAAETFYAELTKHFPTLHFPIYGRTFLDGLALNPNYAAKVNPAGMGMPGRVA